MSIVVLLLLSVLAIPVARASPGTIELIGKEWNHDPLKVYIKAPSTLVPHVLQALNDWSTALGGSDLTDGRFNFKVVSSSKEADITISVEKGAAAGVLGLTQIQDRNRDGYFDKVKIMVKVGRGLDLADFRNIVRHEVGHALGLGHEITTESDLMDPIYDASIDYDVSPSTLDIGALLYIYKSDGFGGTNLSPEDISPAYTG